jgi:hypothetical protein
MKLASPYLQAGMIRESSTGSMNEKKCMQTQLTTSAIYGMLLMPVAGMSKLPFF